MCQQATNGWLEDSGGRSTLSLRQLEVIPEAASERGKHSQLSQVVPLAAGRLFLKLRNRKMGSKKKNVGTHFWVPNLAPKNGGQRNGTNGWGPLRCPPFWGAKLVPKNGYHFLKKNPFFLISFFGKKLFFFQHELLRMLCFSLFSFTKGPTKQTEKVRPT